MEYRTATTTGSIWKPVTCEGCGCKFEYKMTRTGSATNSAASESFGGADRQGLLNITEYGVKYQLENETDLVPCPSCGIYQSDMATIIRLRTGWILPVLLIILLILLALIDSAFESINLRAGPTLLSVIIIGAIAYIPLSRLLQNLSERLTQWNHDRLNSTLESNKRKAAELMKKGTLRSNG